MNALVGIAIYVDILAVMVSLTACSVYEQPVQLSEPRATAISGHIISDISYRVPRGIFRGVLWPAANERYFRLWVIRNHSEIYYKVKPPVEMSGNEVETTDKWSIAERGGRAGIVVYSLANVDMSKVLRIELPSGVVGYSFAVLRASERLDVIIYLTMTDSVVGSGLFGYVCI